MDEFNKHGYFIIKNMLPAELVNRSLVEVKSKLVEAAQQLSISLASYTECTGRWDTSSTITMTASDILHSSIEATVQDIFENKLVLKKSNVICKSATNSNILPFHQDISYSFRDPYRLSIWVPLSDVDETSAPLKIITGSHTWEVQPLVDFWDPNFTDSHQETTAIISLPVTAGDGILFDAKLWHGSGINTSGQDRFVYVTRWVIQDDVMPQVQVPTPKPTSFGILNSGSVTERILSDYLRVFHPIYFIEALTFEEITRIYSHNLKKDSNFCNFLSETDRNQAKLDVHRLDVLNQASRLHGAGDVSGTIYKNLWISLLSFLEREIQASSHS